MPLNWGISCGDAEGEFGSSLVNHKNSFTNIVIFLFNNKLR